MSNAWVRPNLWQTDAELEENLIQDVISEIEDRSKDANDEEITRSASKDD